MAEPRTHYQISLTAAQAVGLFAGVLAALGVAYFFGLMTGLSGRAKVERETAPVSRRAAAVPSGDALPAVETAVPTAAAGSRGPSHTELAPVTPAPAGASGEPTPPSAIQTFDDASSEEAVSPPAAGAPKAAAAPAHAAAPAPPPGRYWVQVASLTSHDEASSLSGRLSKHGFHNQVSSAPGPKGTGKVFRVRVGPYRSEDEAGRAAAKLGQQEKIKSPWVVPEGR